MAITEAHPNLQVQILANNVPLEEFIDEDEHTSPSTVIRYIESQSDVEFTIASKLSKPWPGCNLMLGHYVDGKYVTGTFMMQEEYIGDAATTLVQGKKHFMHGNWYLQKFCFSDLKIEASGAPAIMNQPIKDLKELGEIKVEIFRVRNLKTVQDVASASTSGFVGDVPEKALKGRALSHQSSFRPPAATAGVITMNSEYMDGIDKPMAVFIFKYRSRAALQSLLIVPRTPSPVPLEERELNALTHDESLELIRRLREREQLAISIKREGIKRERSRERSSTLSGAGEDGDDDITVVSTKRRRLPTTVNVNGVETIDLT